MLLLAVGINRWSAAFSSGGGRPQPETDATHAARPKPPTTAFTRAATAAIGSRAMWEQANNNNNNRSRALSFCIEGDSTETKCWCEIAKFKQLSVCFIQEKRRERRRGSGRTVFVAFQLCQSRLKKNATNALFFLLFRFKDKNNNNNKKK